MNSEEIVRIITPDVVRRAYEHAQAEYPRECCGMIHAGGLVRCCKNAQDELHRMDPEQFPRTARCGYCFAAEALLFIVQSFESPDPVRVVYHSHCDCAADFSAADRAAAMWEGRPVYPGLLHLIVSCVGGEAREALLYSLDTGGVREVRRFDALGTNNHQTNL